MHFDNLFNGDYLLGETINRFLNDNWKELLRETRPLVKKAVAAIYKAILQPFFVKYPYDDFFLRDGEKSIV